MQLTTHEINAFHESPGDSSFKRTALYFLVLFLFFQNENAHCANPHVLSHVQQACARLLSKARDWVDETRFHPSHGVKVLQEVRKGAIDLIEDPRHENVFVVFDLDETGIDNRYTFYPAIHGSGGWLESEGAKKFQNLATLFAALPREKYGENVHETFFRLGLKTRGRAFENVQKFWLTRLHNNDHISAHTTFFPGFLDYVKSLRNYGVQVVFLTGRNEFTQGEGTRRVLRNLGVSEEDGFQLIMKKNKSAPTAVFKARELLALAEKGHLTAVFDNEPTNLMESQKELKETAHVLVLTHFNHLPSESAQDLYVMRDVDWAGRDWIRE